MLDVDLKTGRSKSDMMPREWQVRKPKLKSGRSAMSTGQVRQLVTARIRKETLDAFGCGIDLATFMRRKRSDRFLDLKSIEGLRSAYDKAIERSGKLNHALSRAQMERDENQFLFREAVDLGEQLKNQNVKLEEKLERQKDLSSRLKAELRMTREEKLILVEELEHLRHAETKAAHVQEQLSKSKAELKLHKKMINRIQDDHETARNNWDVDVQEEFDKLAKELRKETASREKAEEDLREAEARLVEAERQVELLKENINGLRIKHDSDTNQLSEEILKLCTEKAFQDLNYEALLRDYNSLESQLKEDSEKLFNSEGLVSARISNLEEPLLPRMKGPSLAEQVDLARRDSHTSGFSELEIDFNDKSTAQPDGIADDNLDIDLNKYASQSDGSPQLAEVFRTYLYISAVAVKLHFPDLDDVHMGGLIEHAESSPFYLFYDLMMAYMREKTQEKAVDEIKNSDSNLSSARVEQSSWLERFKRLKQKPAKPQTESRRSTSYLKPSDQTRSPSSEHKEDIDGTPSLNGRFGKMKAASTSIRM